MEGERIIVFDDDCDDNGNFGYLLLEGNVARIDFRGEILLSVSALADSRKFLLANDFKLFVAGKIKWEDILQDT